MSVYKDKDGRSPYWHYDFQINGRRFHGSTKTRTAEAFERAVRERAIKNPLVVQPRKRSFERRSSKLYVIRATSTTQFKFGLTVQPRSRLSDLKVGSCLLLELVLAIEIAAAEIERELHRALAPWHSHGEWFDLGTDAEAFLAKVHSDGLLAALRTLREPSPVPRRSGGVR